MNKEISQWHIVRQRCNKICPTCDCNRQSDVSKVMDIIELDGRYAIRNIAKEVVISLSRVHFITKRILKVEMISVRRIPHIFTNDQKQVSTNCKAIVKSYLPNSKSVRNVNLVKYCCFFF